MHFIRKLKNCLAKIRHDLIYILILLLLACLVPGENVSAQEPTPQDIRFRHISTEEGLSHPVVYAIAQDSQGFMWFGTEEGLNCYDGYTVEMFTPDPNNPNSISGTTPTALLVDRAGSLWIGTRGDGVNKLDLRTYTFTHYQHEEGNPNSLSNNNIRFGGLYQDPDGYLWISTLGGGLNKLDPATETFTHYHYDDEDPTSLSNDFVWDVEPATLNDGSHILWVGTAHGLNRFDPHTETFTRFYHTPDSTQGLSNDDIRTLFFAAEDNVLWVGTAGGLNRLDLATETWTSYVPSDTDPHSLIRDEIYDIAPGDDGTLWVSTHSGLDHFNPTTGIFTHYTHNPDNPDSLSNNTAHPIFQDREGGLWVGTWGGGINYAHPARQKFRLYRYSPNASVGLAHASVLSLYTAPSSGMVWVGTWGGGLQRFDPNTETFTTYQHNPDDPHSLSHNTVSAVYEDSTGLLCVGTYGGLNAFDPKTETFTRFLHDETNPYSISDNSIRGIVEDNDGMLWVATTNGGLNRLDRATMKCTHYQHNPDDPRSLIYDNVWALLYDSHDTLWIATGNGLDRFDPDTEHFFHYRHDENKPHSVNSNLIINMYEDSNGIIWVATNRGLNRFDRATEQFTSYTIEDGMPSNRIVNIIEDDAGFLWLGTNRGLARFDPLTETVRTYDVEDGLQSNIFFYPAATKLPNGELLFGGDSGMNRFHPDDLVENPIPPPVVLTEFQLSNEPVPVRQDSILPQDISSIEHLVLSSKESNFSIAFAALSYVAPSKNRYRYILEGFDQTWNTVESERRFATYTNLDPGEYVFRVQGANNDGVWNEQGVALRITITPQWWETWWFRGSVVVLIGGFFVGVYLWRLHDMQLHKQELEHQVAARTQELQQSRVDLAWAHEIAGVGSFRYDLVSGINRWSENLCRMMRLETSEWHGTLEETARFIHPDDLPAIQQAHDAVIAGRLKQLNLDIRLIRPDGSICVMHQQSEAIHDEHGNIIGTFGTVQDITERKRIEDELCKSEERLQHILEFSPQGTLVLDEQGIILYANPMAHTLLRKPTLVGMPFGLPLTKCLHCEIEVEVVPPDIGVVLELRVIQTNWQDTPSYIVSMTNITERKQSEQALQESEARYRLLAESMSDVVWTTDKEGRFTYVSPSVYRLRGYTPDEVLQQTMADALTPESFQKVQKQIESLFSGGTAHTNYAELEQPCKDGTTVWTEAAANAIRDEDGNVIGWMGVSRNITARRQAEEKIRKLSRAVEQSPTMVVITDTSGTIEYVNAQFTLVTGYTVEEALGKNPRILKSGLLDKHIYTELWETILSGNEWRGEFYNMKKNGNLFWEYASISPILDDSGKITHFVAVKEDITARKQIEAELLAAREKAEAANQAKSIFLANMSHELRSPLNAIIGFAQVMQRNADISTEYRDYLAIIMRSGEHLLGLINDVLDMSKIEAGWAVLNESVFDVRQMVADIEGMFWLRAQEKGLHLHIACDVEVPQYVCADEQKVRQVLINLLSNAIKFTNEGSVVVHVSMRPSQDNLVHRVDIEDVEPPKAPPGPPVHGGESGVSPLRVGGPVGEKSEDTHRLYVTVHDTGQGIASDEIEHVFDAFVQTQAGRKSQEGTGLGLSISHRFVQLMGGDMTVQSEVGHGTTFTFDIGVTVVDANDSDSLSQVEWGRVVGLAPGQPDYRVLVVDDLLENRHLLVTLLTNVGFLVREVCNGQEALEVWEQWQPHCIWMDIRMPVMNGYEATQLIKSTIAGQNTVIIGLSAGVFEEERESILAIGCADFITKPFRKETIFDTMRKHLGVEYRYEQHADMCIERAVHKHSHDTQPHMVFRFPPGLSIEWLEQMNWAATIGDIDMLADLVAQIAPTHEACIAELHALIDMFAFDKLVQLTNEALHERPGE